MLVMGPAQAPAPKEPLDGQRPLPGSGLGKQHLPLCVVWLLQSSSVGNQPRFKVSFQRKSLLAALRQWQVSADCSSAGICHGHHCPLPVVSPPAKIHFPEQHLGRPVQLWLFLCKAARAAIPQHPPSPASLLAQDIGNLGFGEIPARVVPRRGSSRSPPESACEDGVPQPWLAQEARAL